ncbi:hypothetical protein [Achromobacter sp. 2789STDY5608633]|uniref:hypothetical protein n=1 Tax=Achromobacter sp. 2789STDY5608633 TaxID=1806501 RepID=UPI0006C84BFF|nr:hypothetical protein [Achromobacter sp. 2789STDY5608633]
MTKRATFDMLSRASTLRPFIPLSAVAAFAVACISWSLALQMLPVDPRAVTWISLTTNFALAMVPLFCLSMFVAMLTSRVQPLYALSRAICGGLTVGMLFGLAAMFMNTFGDRIFQFLDGSPDVAMCIALALFGGFAWKCGVDAARVDAAFSGPAEAASYQEAYMRPSSNDVRRIAAHEASHVVLYAALGENLPDLLVTLRDAPDSTGSLGSVTMVAPTDRLPQVGFVEWQMLVFLAGAEGERLLEGSYSLGAAEDKQRWLGLAKPYLSAFHGPEVYYQNSDNPAEVQSNAAALSALHSAQVRQVQAFLHTNLQVMKDIAGLLQEQKTLDREDLLPHLRRVAIPADFPLPVQEDRLFPGARQSNVEVRCG